MAVPMGLFYSLGALFVPFMTAFQVSRTEASLIQSVAVAVGLSTGLIHGLLIHRFGMVKTGLAGATLASLGFGASFFATSLPFLVVTIGIATSIGSICLYIVSSAAVGQYFVGKTSFILLSFVNACSGIGGMVFPIILVFLNNKFGLRGTLLICSGLVMNTIPSALLWTQPQRKRKTVLQTITKSKDVFNISHGETSGQNGCNKTEKNTALTDNKHQDISSALSNRLSHLRSVATSPENGEMHKTHPSFKESIKQLGKNKSFIFFIAGLAFSYPPIMVLITFIADTFRDSGLSTQDASIGLLLLNACGIIGRLLPGLMMQSKYITTMTVPVLASLLAAGSMTGLLLTKSLHMKLLFSGLSGVPYGMFVSCFTVTTFNIVGCDHLGNATGFAFTFNGLANIVAGPLSGFIRDSTGSYLVVFLLAAGIQFVAVFMFVIAHMYLNIIKKQTSDRYESAVYVTKL